MTDAVGGFRVGSSARFDHVITSDDIKRFVELTGDDNPLHVDPEFADRTDFKGIVAHGMLSASFISTIIGKHIPGPGALWMSQSLEFLQPVRIGDRLTISAEVTAVQVSQRVLTLRTEVRNQHDQGVLTGESRVKVLPVREDRPRESSKRDVSVAVVTGASRGIGAATARCLAAKGFRVVVNYRDDEAAARRVVSDITSQGGHATAVRADVARESDVRVLVESAVASYGGISAIVHCAAPPVINKPFTGVQADDIVHDFEVHVLAVFHLVRQALPHLEKAANASVVTVGSIYADMTPPTQMLSYVTAKSALSGLTHSLAADFGPSGIRFNMIAAGMTETRLIANLPDKAKMVARMQTPLRRLADPNDIANGIAFLLSADAAHITGETLRISGGVVMR